MKTSPADSLASLVHASGAAQAAAAHALAAEHHAVLHGALLPVVGALPEDAPMPPAGRPSTRAVWERGAGEPLLRRAGCLAAHLVGLALDAVTVPVATVR